MQSEGYVVDYAILTTYSLDMPSLLSVPFMLGAMSDMTEATMRSPHLVLQAVNKSAGKFFAMRDVSLSHKSTPRYTLSWSAV